MNNLTNISNDCLYDCKEQMRSCILSSNLNIDPDEICSVITERIDVEKFKEWLERNIYIFKTRDNKQTYFNRAFINELQKGTFELKIPSLSYVTLIMALREKGITVYGVDTCYLEVMWNWLVEHGCDIKAAQKLNRQIVDYMKEGQTFNDYVNLVKKSKLISAMTVDWDSIQAQYQKELDEWDELSKQWEELDKEED